MTTIMGWHFLYDDGKLRDRRFPPPDGEWLSVDGYIQLCSRGLHASERIIDALKFAPGSVICRVELRGDIQESYRRDKLVARERRILWHLNAKVGSRVLHEFSRWAALQVIDLWDAPSVVRDYLETGNESLRHASGYASGFAARVGEPQAAAWYATRTAAGSATRVAWDAAMAARAAYNNTGHPAEKGARAVTEAAQNAKLAELATTAAGRSKP